MSAGLLEFLIPGKLQTATGGYGYDRRIIEGLRELGWAVAVHELDPSFPRPSAAALDHARTVLANIGDGALVLIDGLALGAMPDVIKPHTTRLLLVALVHHPLAAETGAEPAISLELEQSERQALQLVRHVIVTSRATKEALVHYRMTSERVSVVEPGTDPAPLARRGVGCVNLLCVAAVIPRKGHDVLIAALAALRTLRWRLTCVGSVTHSPGTVTRLRAQLNRTGLTQRVTLVGEVPATVLKGLFLESDLFVLATRHEGYGMAVAEALAYGLPVVTTRTGAIPDLVGSKAGVLVPPDNVGLLRAALARVLNQPTLRASLATGAVVARRRLSRWPQACVVMSQTLQGIGARAREQASEFRAPAS
jgi:glycosyltransferase involved in cell wall biosynthesis